MYVQALAEKLAEEEAEKERIKKEERKKKEEKRRMRVEMGLDPESSEEEEDVRANNEYHWLRLFYVWLSCILSSGALMRLFIFTVPLA